MEECKKVKCLQNGDLVYVVCENSNTVVECTVRRINFVEYIEQEKGYFTKAMHGVLESGKNKIDGMFGLQDKQMFDICTAGIWDENVAEAARIKNLKKYYPFNPGGIPLGEYENQLESTMFTIFDRIRVFTNEDDAKNYIVDKKLESIKEDLKKLIKVKRYKEK